MFFFNIRVEKEVEWCRGMLEKSNFLCFKIESIFFFCDFVVIVIFVVQIEQNNFMVVVLQNVFYFWVFLKSFVYGIDYMRVIWCFVCFEFVSRERVLFILGFCVWFWIWVIMSFGFFFYFIYCEFCVELNCLFRVWFIRGVIQDEGCRLWLG